MKCKARSNVEKHGVTFEEAAEVFLDPFYIVGDASANREEREFALGYSIAERLLLVVYIERGVKTRIISARVASFLNCNYYRTSFIWTSSALLASHRLVRIRDRTNLTRIG